MRNDVTHLIKGLLRQNKNRTFNSGASQFNSFLNQRNAQPMGSGFKRGFSNLNRTMSVAIGFHHDHDFGFANQRTQIADVVAHSIQININPSCSSAHLQSCEPTCRICDKANGMRSTKSDAIKPSSALNNEAASP